ncbi:MAG TPA: cysteine--tRNA ligase [Bacteroidales bacterium]|nr:cysteine--tRNA ligase [Bacteroidales bacterium]HPB89025.1 cysteine--tRNA ligase [Bacteroidales bacterium]HPY21859.1 cysteine--tRNA ligase [Bacteroidales bacterium]HQA93456.1 cysteine--tRNA ligase [Bacteroidales bacterium]HQN24004.1 cysteine--tRNA ligase [Bacteroidales bacterium]
MARDLFLYDTLKREKRIFKPVNPGHVGMYVCGPTVYGDPHLGHARPGITFDLLFRLFKHLGYKVRYVSNITDVGHLENDADTGEDKIAKKARLEELEPMEIVQTYTLRYHEAMKQLNVLRPSIEPRASGHIIEQIELVKTILDAGYAYVSNGSVYFDVEKYNSVHTYGVLSGRILDEMMAGSRELDGQEDKRSPNDFALWKKAPPEHIMRWPSPWSVGFPGWHLECSAMSEKYLGEEFDIHGGGMDLIFPHHECELAQNVASRGKGGVNYWVHNNLITINGQKMGKSKGNFITLEELFAGKHEALDQPYSPMTIRFFILQAHYRSTLDFSNEALQAAEKGLKRLMQAAKDVRSLKHSADAPVLKQVATINEEIYEALLDDMNTPIALSSLFEAVKIVNGAKDRGEVLNDADYDTLTKLFTEIVSDVMGLTDDRQDSTAESVISGLMDMVIERRNAAKAAKNWAESDRIRDELKAIGIQIKDTKEGTEWELTK